MSTLRDIAQKANVTISTVSRALNGKMEIKESTRERIVQIARELNYYTNKNEREYVGLTLKTIGIICPEIISSFYANIVNSMGAAIKQAGYTMIIGLTNFKYQDECHYLNLYADKKVDGIVFITTVNEKMKEELHDFKARCSIPLVQLASNMVVEEYDSIKIDEKLAINLAMEQLIDLGHRDIAFIGENLTKVRHKYYLEALKKYDIKIDSDFIKVSEERFEEAGYTRMKEILSMKGKMPTAILASYDDIAIGAMKAIFENGLNIPEDISIMGIDNIYLTPYLYKALSTVATPTKEMTSIAINILLNKIEDKSNKVVQHVTVKPELILRETTAKVKEIV